MKRSKKPKVAPKVPKVKVRKHRREAPSRFARRPKETGDDSAIWWNEQTRDHHKQI